MEDSFSAVLWELRREKKLSQRNLSDDLNISQALLSHYENGSREPGLAFVKRVCEYFGVSADYMLGLSPEEGENKGCVFPAVTELSELCEKSESESVKNAASAYVEAAARRMAGHITRGDDAVFIARTACEMAQAELSLLCALTPQGGGDDRA